MNGYYESVVNRGNH